MRRTRRAPKDARAQQHAMAFEEFERAVAKIRIQEQCRPASAAERTREADASASPAAPAAGTTSLGTGHGLSPSIR